MSIYDPSISWVPKPRGPNDFALMPFAICYFGKEDTIRINRCRIYLCVIMAYDLYTFDCTHIHPDIQQHTPVFSRDSNIQWIHSNKPPKQHWVTWEKIMVELADHMKNLSLCCITSIPNHYGHNYSYCTRYGTVHYWDGSEFHTYLPRERQPGMQNNVFSCINRIVNRAISLISLQPVEIQQLSQDLIIIGRIKQQSCETSHHPLLQWRNIAKEARQLCGKISMLIDQGKSLMEYIRSNNTPLIGVSDASVVDGNGRHA
jgi:hypothetical protein